MEKVSIIVPMYNVDQYVEKCLRSLTSQTFRDIKIYAISDGSPDNSIQVAQKIAKEDNRIVCIEKENGGYGSVLEFAINKIKSKYFCICDPDDWLEENAIEVLYDSIKSNDCDLVVGNLYDYYKDGTKTKKTVVKNCVAGKVYESGKLLNFALAGVSPHSKLYKTSIAKKIIFPHKISYTDTILYLVYLSYIDNAVFIDEALSYHFLDRDGNSNADLISFSMRTFEQLNVIYDSIFTQIDYKSKDYNHIIYALYKKLNYLRQKIKYLDYDERKKAKSKLKALSRKILTDKKEVAKNINDSNVIVRFIKRIRLYLFECLI